MPIADGESLPVTASTHKREPTADTVICDATERRSMELSHVAIWVSDLEQSLEFYEALGLVRAWSFSADGVENVYVRGESGELQLRHDPDRTTPIAPTRADTDHVAFGVEDEVAVDAATEAAREAGGSVVADPHAVEPADAYAAFVEDPDGYTLEFVAPLERE